jgi:uncharacterized RDD family membrane protein YckC
VESKSSGVNVNSGTYGVSVVVMEESINESLPDTAGLLGRRFIALCIDLFVLSGLLIVLAVLTWGEIGYVLDLPRRFLWLLFGWFGIDVTDHSLLTTIGPDLLAVVGIYLITFWRLFGKTPGMAYMGLKLINKNGKRCSVISGIVRFLTGPIMIVLIVMEIMAQIGWAANDGPGSQVDRINVEGIYMMYFGGPLLSGILGLGSQLAHPSQRGIDGLISGTDVVDD